jgi:hypothetical protein
MTTIEKIQYLEQILRNKCYYYAYIDDKYTYIDGNGDLIVGVRGTIDEHEFKIGTLPAYRVVKNKVIEPFYFNKGNADNYASTLRAMGPGYDISVKSVILPALHLHKDNDANSFIPGIGKRILYLLKDDGKIGTEDKEVIGTVISNGNGNNELINMKYNVLEPSSNKKQKRSVGNVSDEDEDNPETEKNVDFSDKYQVYIDNVDIDEESQDKGLCKIMMQLFLLNANFSAGENLSFCLDNDDGICNCKCYARAFEECGYEVFGYINEYSIDNDNDAITKKIEMTHDECDIIYPKKVDKRKHYNPDDPIGMGFVYSGLIGGKRSAIKRKNRKTKKSRKIKKMKNRKNIMSTKRRRRCASVS